METPNLPAIRAVRPAWNNGRIVGQSWPVSARYSLLTGEIQGKAANFIDIRVWRSEFDKENSGLRKNSLEELTGNFLSQNTVRSFPSRE